MFFKEAIVVVAVATAFSINIPVSGQNGISNGFPRDPAHKNRQVKNTCEDDTVALVKFSDETVDPLDESCYSQQFQSFFQSIGEKYTSIVINFRLSFMDVFLNTIVVENGISEHNDRKPLQVFLLISLDSFQGQSSFLDINNFRRNLGKYVGKDGIISGLVLEASLIQNPNPSLDANYKKDFDDAACLNVPKFISLLHMDFGDELQMGLSVNLHKDCADLLVNEMAQVISLFDMIIFNASYMDCEQTLKDNPEKTNEYFVDCVKSFQDKFQFFILPC